MADKLDELLGLASKQDDAPTTAKKATKTEKSKAAAAPDPIYSPMKDILWSVSQVAKIIGFEYLRIETSETEMKIWGADGIDKTIFMNAVVVPKDTICGSYALSDFEALVPLLDDGQLVMNIVSEEVKVFNKVDPSNEDSVTVEELVSRPKFLVFGRCKHKLLNLSVAPKAQLKAEPEWTAKITLDPASSFDQFKKHAVRLKKSADKFNALLEGQVLTFRIGGVEDHNVEIPVGVCSVFDGVARHSWIIQIFLNVLKCATALSAVSIDIAISAVTGLMKVAFIYRTPVGEEIAFAFIIPGKIID